ncbi:hypothetical protein CP02DC21_0267A, partial [Chlamydia psittaci 02DC21]
MRGGGGA